MIGMIERPSPNHDARGAGSTIDMVVLHYTGMRTAAAALDRLCDPASRVSSHYVVDEDGTVYRLVDDGRRAWHAGVACWAGATDINARSLGIEIVNPGHEFGYRPFPAAQIEAVARLTGELVRRHGIDPRRVVGHADVAPSRKEDPGEFFDWARLARDGLGLWPSADFTVSPHAPDLSPGMSGPAVLNLQIALDAIGYRVEGTGLYDESLEQVVVAFQRHFRQRLFDGVADGETVSLIHHLAELSA